MARPEPFQSIDDGIIAALEAQGITCYPFEGNALPGPLPLATCVAEDGLPGFRGPQQGFKLGNVDYVVRYYTAFLGDPALCWQDAYDGLAKIMAAFGGDITLGAKVAAIDISRFSIQIVRANDTNVPELMVEVFTSVKSGPH
jgi:hypothetical protein